MTKAKDDAATDDNGAGDEPAHDKANREATRPQSDVPRPGLDLTQNVPVGHEHIGDGSDRFPHQIRKVDSWNS